MKLESQHLLELSNTLRTSIATHEVKKKLRDSLLEDIMFHVANLVDEAQGSNFHETIFEALEAYEPPPEDYLVCELLLSTNTEKKLESNILLSDIEREGNLKLNLEVLLELRDLSEIDAEIDCEAKFKHVIFKRVELISLKGDVLKLKCEFKSLLELETEIRKVARKWI